MSRYSSYYDYYPPYVSVAERKAKAERAVEAARKKGKNYEPVDVGSHTRKFCQTWWGQSWCENLERYSDYENRLPRGKSYLRSGAVIDLKISKGQIKAKVMGSGSKPYTVTIRIDPLSKEKAAEIERRCEVGIESLDELAKGNFPEELKDLFTEEGGLFPSPQEIHFDCSCPDWAYMCKHVAAVLYGVGVRLDQKPMLFFELRNIDPNKLVQKAITNKLEAMLKHANRPSKRILHEDPDTLFGL